MVLLARRRAAKKRRGQPSIDEQEINRRRQQAISGSAKLKIMAAQLMAKTGELQELRKEGSNGHG